MCECGGRCACVSTGESRVGQENDPVRAARVELLEHSGGLGRPHGQNSNGDIPAAQPESRFKRGFVGKIPLKSGTVPAQAEIAVNLHIG